MEKSLLRVSSYLGPETWRITVKKFQAVEHKLIYKFLHAAFSEQQLDKSDLLSIKFGSWQNAFKGDLLDKITFYTYCLPGQRDEAIQAIRVVTLAKLHDIETTVKMAS